VLGDVLIVLIDIWRLHGYSLDTHKSLHVLLQLCASCRSNQRLAAAAAATATAAAAALQ
jgi:hypothetical protein